MKSFFRTSLILSIAVFIIASCSVEKRIYRRGYHVAWNSKHSKETKKQEVLKNEKPSLANEIVTEEVVAAANRESDIDLFTRRPLLILNNDTCGDVILLQNADELKVKILEIDEKNIKYKRCDNVDGPTYSISKSRVALIKYANGTKEVVMQEPVQKPAEQERPQQPEMPRKINPLGLASLLLYILGMILSKGSTAAGLSGSVTILLALLALAPIVMAYISLFQFKREPDKYKGRWMPITVVCMYLAFLLILALLLTTLGAYFGSAAILGPFIIACLILFCVFLGILIAALVPKATPPTKSK
ncbi:MAG: hypothetical protein KBG47_08475 [Bacteroidia bacterium]|jgi:hypothetical protein|nr:hypothetical protein [Sphingobacteriaceae bacterium]MBP9069529.1 hypothetical protein [Bacteroidia bacterium]